MKLKIDNIKKIEKRTDEGNKTIFKTKCLILDSDHEKDHVKFKTFSDIGEIGDKFDVSLDESQKDLKSIDKNE